MEPPSPLDPHHRSLGWGSLGLGPLLVKPNNLLLSKGQRSPLPGQEQMRNPSTKCHTQKQPSLGKAAQPWARSGEGCCGSSFRTLGCVCLTPGEDSSPTFLCSAGFSEFLIAGDHKFLFLECHLFLQLCPPAQFTQSYCSLTSSTKSLSTLISCGSFHLIRSSLECLCPESPQCQAHLPSHRKWIFNLWVNISIYKESAGEGNDF